MYTNNFLLTCFLVQRKFAKFTKKLIFKILFCCTNTSSKFCLEDEKGLNKIGPLK